MRTQTRRRSRYAARVDEIADLLLRWLPEYGVAADAAARDRLATFVTLIQAGQQRLRLVGSAEPEVLVKRHLGESLALGRLRRLGSEHLVDVGSGAGFPGLALALAHPRLKTTLVESNQRKIEFLRAVVTKFGLGDRVDVWDQFLQHRPPGSGRGPLEGAELITVRALDKMEEVPGWLSRWLDAGAEVAYWITSRRVQTWSQKWPHWNWGRSLALPGASERIIQLASVPRETSAGGDPDR